MRGAPPERADDQIDTPRLIMRPFRPGDGPAHARMYADPEVTRFLPRGPFGPTETAERSRSALERFMAHWREHGFGVWAVLDRDTGVLVGQCGLSRVTALGEVELLYALVQARWRQGLAPEAGRAALDHAFRRLQLARVVALARADNRGSLRVMDKLGLVYERNVHVFGLDAVCYAVSRQRFLDGGQAPPPGPTR